MNIKDFKLPQIIYGVLIALCLILRLPPISLSNKGSACCLAVILVYNAVFPFLHLRYSGRQDTNILEYVALALFPIISAAGLFGIWKVWHLL